jgi:hypothetical protein
MKRRYRELTTSATYGYFPYYWDCENRSNKKVEKIVHKYLRSQYCEGWNDDEEETRPKSSHEWFSYPSLSTVYNLIQHVDEYGEAPDWNMTPSIWNTEDDCDCHSDYEDSDSDEEYKPSNRYSKIVSDYRTTQLVK